MNTAEVLKRAKARIVDSEHWCRHELSRDPCGVPLPPTDSRVWQWCATGAILAEGSASLWEADAVNLALDFLGAAASEAIGIDRPVRADVVNDKYDHAVVMRMYDLAIEKAERES